MKLPHAAEAGIQDDADSFWGGRAVSVKKAKGKGKGTAKKSAKKSGGKKKPVDMVRVRESINNLVGGSAEKIAIEVIKVALTGQLATAKYLFEAVGLYPPTEETTTRPIETSLAHTLLTRMGLPLEPVVCDEDPAPAVLPKDGEGRSADFPGPSVREKNPEGEREGATRMTPAESQG
jgi:hypothetical protein